MSSNSNDTRGSPLDNWQPEWDWSLGNLYGYRTFLAEKNQQLDDHRYHHFQLQRMSTVYCARITDLDISKSLDDATKAELIHAINEYHVLVFPRAGLAPDQILHLGTQFGELNINPLRNYAKEGKKVDVVAHDGDRNSVENVWHIDETWRPVPPWLIFIQINELSQGGDTLFSCLESAYHSLDPRLQEMLSSVYCEYDHRCWLKEDMFAHFDPAPVMDKFPPLQHPIVSEHPLTGRKQLYFSPTFLSKLVGLPEGVSQDEVIMRLLWALSVPEFQCRMSWQPGDLAIFDNYANIHYATFDYWPNGRSISRMSVALPSESRSKVESRVRSGAL